MNPGTIVCIIMVGLICLVIGHIIGRRRLEPEIEYRANAKLQELIYRRGDAVQEHVAQGNPLMQAIRTDPSGGMLPRGGIGHPPPLDRLRNQGLTQADIERQRQWRTSQEQASLSRQRSSLSASSPSSVSAPSPQPRSDDGPGVGTGLFLGLLAGQAMRCPKTHEIPPGITPDAPEARSAGEASSYPGSDSGQSYSSDTGSSPSSDSGSFGGSSD